MHPGYGAGVKEAHLKNPILKPLLLYPFPSLHCPLPRICFPENVGCVNIPKLEIGNTLFQTKISWGHNFQYIITTCVCSYIAYNLQYFIHVELVSKTVQSIQFVNSYVLSISYHINNVSCLNCVYICIQRVYVVYIWNSGTR